MPKAGWKRRTAGWALGSAGVVLAVAWAVSGWYDVYRVWKVPGGAWLAGVRFGGVEVNRYWSISPRPGYFVERRPGVFRNGWFRYATSKNATGNTEFWLYAPLWPVALACAGGGASLVWWGRHAETRRRGRCAFCGYDLRGIDEAAVCPECGEPGRGQ